MAILQLNEEKQREESQDNAIAQLISRIETLERIRLQTKCIIQQLHERIDFLETNDTYLMDWRVKHDSEVAREKRRK